MNLATEFDQDESIQELLKEEERKNLPKIIIAKVEIENVPTVAYTHNSTGEINKVSIVNGKIQMMQGRTYYIPVGTELNSDDYKSIKIPSDMADKIDVRFIKEKYACVVPLQHNTIIKNGQRICIMTL